MADIKPFRGIRYNPAVAGSLGLNVSPPFDMITPALQRDLYERSDYNIVRLELARRRLGGDPYASAAESQQRWMGAGALTRDDEPSVYVTEERFSFLGSEYVRRGVIAAVRVEEYDRNVVLPHEYTRQEWVLDRVRLMGVAGYNYSSLLVLFRDDLRSTVGGIIRAVAGGKPTATAAPPDMPELRMWRLSDPGTIEVLANSFAQNQLFIADGHHRYEAALRFRSRVRSEREVDPGESINYRMMMLVSVSEPGLVTRGYHRTIQNASGSELSTITSLLRERTTLTKWGPGDATVATKFADSLANMTGDEAVFGIYGLEKGVCHVARLEPSPRLRMNSSAQSTPGSMNCCSGRRFHRSGKPKSSVFPTNRNRAMEAVDNGEAQLAIIMRPVPMDQFMGIVTRGWRLPPKATNFHPKPSAGSVIQSLEGPL